MVPANPQQTDRHSSCSPCGSARAIASVIAAHGKAAAASPSRTLTACLVAYVLATAAHAWSERAWLPIGAWPAALAALGIASLIARAKSPRRAAALVAIVVCAAWWRFDASVPDPRPLPAGTEHRGLVVREPVLRDSAFRITVGGVRAAGRDLGTMFVSTADGRYIREGDDLAWRCRSRRGGADPRYAAFCDADGPVRVVGHGFHPLLSLRARLRAAVRAMLPEPEASLQLGLLVGDRGGLPPALIEDFRITGTTHVLAVSGYNVSLVAGALATLFGLLGAARRRAALLVIGCVVGFAGLAGADPPVVRAALMGGAGLLATALGRRPHGPNAIFLAAALMLAWDPQALRHDVAFRLSFAAVIGLGAFGGKFADRLTFIPSDGVRSALGETLGATLATLPIMLHDFGSFATSSPLTNVMIAPLVPFATAVGAVASVLTLVSMPMGTRLGLPLAAASGAALRLMRAIVSWWAESVPAIPVEMGAAAAYALYVPIALVWWRLRDRERI